MPSSMLFVAVIQKKSFKNLAQNGRGSKSIFCLEEEKNFPVILRKSLLKILTIKETNFFLADKHLEIQKVSQILVVTKC